MADLIVPKDYTQPLNVYQMQRAIEFIKERFQRALGAALNLKRVSAPLILRADSGLNDDLSGTERPVSFDVPALGDGSEIQVAQSLAKWKRWALRRYDFYEGKGLYCDMNAVRRDEAALDNTHSVYVDQWDWEKAITAEQRSEAFLRDTVRRIVGAVCNTADELKWEFPCADVKLEREVTFVSSQQLEDELPQASPEQRETEYARRFGTVFVTQIGGKMRSGQRHGLRAPDYDDWSFNGDLIFWDSVLGQALEISSMGIRVDPETLDRQLTEAGCDVRRALPYHRELLAGRLPLTIGGGIGQSRLCMLLLGCAHIGEVQSSVWDAHTRETCEQAGIRLL